MVHSTTTRTTRPQHPGLVVRASEFCRPRRLPPPLPQQCHGVTCLAAPAPPHHDDDVTIPPWRRQEGHVSKSQAFVTAPNVVYATSLDLLRQVGLTAGSLAWLTTAPTTTTTTRRRSIVVRVGLWIQRQEQQEEKEHPPADGTQQLVADAAKNDAGSTTTKTTTTTARPLVLYVSRLTAINLGFDWCCLRDDEEEDAAAVVVLEAASFSDFAAVANQVTLSAVGRPFLATAAANDAVQPSPSSPHWPLPVSGTLLQPGTLIQVVANVHCKKNNDDDDDNNNNCVTVTDYFYEVIEVKSDNHSEQQLKCRETHFNTVNHDTRKSLVYQAATTTSYRFVSFGNSGRGGYVPQLPSLLPQTTSSRDQIPPHPDVSILVQQLRQFAETSTTTPVTVVPAKCCIWHVLGTEHDHHIVQAVTVAAAVVGRQCLVVSGLAAAAYLYNNHNHNNSVSTGGMVDKLSGLQAALDVASTTAHAPCLLLVSDLDQELSRHDDAVRRQEEGRIWSVLIDHLQQQSQIQQPSNSQLPLQVPPVLVIVTTRQPLRTGPLLENLVFASIPASLPDPAYIEYLWKYGDQSVRDTVEETTMKENDKIVRSIAMATIQELMKCRPAREILELRVEYLNKAAEYCSTGDVVAEDDSAPSTTLTQQQLLEALCSKHDETRRRQSGLGRIPTVRWEDVGGLAHVRREIFDAIELPLKYPHLFSTLNGEGGGCGRSGILLYGPPGTGKTLVAKAVATECGLPFVSVKGPELLGSYVGESEAQVRATFQQARELARQNQPQACILFFDELDSLAPRRGDLASGGNVMDRVVATLFAELDKHPDDGSFVFCMGATNRPDLLDPALLRPGRFDRLVYLGVSASDHAKILATQLRKLRLEGDATEMASVIAQQLPPNLTGADLSTIASGGLLRATERLCDEADREFAARLLQQEQQQPERGETAGTVVTVDDVLASWNDDQLEPIVTLEDLRFASRQVVPSVSASELENYEELGQKYRMGS